MLHKNLMRLQILRVMNTKISLQTSDTLHFTERFIQDANTKIHVGKHPYHKPSRLCRTENNGDDSIVPFQFHVILYP